MARLTENEFKKNISSRNFKNLYFIYGEEKYLVKHYSNLLVEKIVGKKPSDFNLQRLTNNDTIDDIIQSAEMLPLGVDKKCVFISDFDINAVSENDLKKFTEFTNDIPEDCIIVFSLVTLSFDTKKIPSKWKKFTDTADKSGIILNCEKRGDTALEKQIVSWAEKRGVKILPAVVRKLIKNCGTDLLVLKNELEKLCAYSNYTEITSEMVSDISVKNLEANIFRLSYAIFNGNSNNAYEILDLLFYQREKAVTILAVLTLAYVDIYRVRVAKESGKNISELGNVFKEYKKNNFRIKNAERDGKKITTDALRKSLDYMAKADTTLKSIKVDERVLMETLIARLLLLVGGQKFD